MTLKFGVNFFKVLLLNTKENQELSNKSDAKDLLLTHLYLFNSRS